MATTGTQEEMRLSPAIPGTLERLRRRIRSYVWLEGTTSAIAWLGVAFWLTLATDWFFEPSRSVRGVILASVGLVLFAVVFRLILRRAFVRLTDDNMAMLLERRFPQLEESLLTTVEVAKRREKARQFNAQMLAHTCHEAEQRIGGLPLRKVFNPVPLRRSLTAALLLAASVSLFGGMFPSALGTWADRMLLFSDELWPRRTRLIVDGFDNGYVKVARGADLEIIAKADLGWRLVPDVVHVRYRIDEGARGTGTMSRVGNAQRGKDAFQEYSYVFQGVLSPIRFDLHGGDDWIEDLRIEVVENPTIIDFDLEYEYPPYMGLSPKPVDVTGVMQVPQGTKVTVVARANKDLVRIQVDSALDGNSKPTVFPPSTEDPRGFRYTIPSLKEDTALLFTLFDTDGIKSREPVPLKLAAVADEAPQLEVRLRGIGPAITPQARIPALGRILDDYGVARTWFEYAVDKEKAQHVAIASPPGNVMEYSLDTALEAHDLNVQPGQKVTIGVKAADRYALGKGPNVGASERWLLDVVTPQQLRTMLESRELVLRQRFEVIVREVEDTRDLLARIEFGPSPSVRSADNEKKGKDGNKAPAGAEPGDKPEAQTSLSPEQIRNRAVMAAQRASQNASKNRHEVLGVADAFDEIREELINNRIDSEKLRSRLKDGIADPLRKIGQEMFPGLEQRLAELEATIADSQNGARNRLLAIQQVDAILVQMRQVLNQMLELETFNEAVAALRAIIESQEKVNEETKKRHQGKLRDLLE